MNTLDTIGTGSIGIFLATAAAGILILVIAYLANKTAGRDK